MTSSHSVYAGRARHSNSDRPHSVYKYYDDHKILIYVGITCTGIARNRQHNASKEWWPFVSEQVVEHCDSREEAHACEVDLIQRFRPPFNIQHNPDHDDLRTAYLELRKRGTMGLDFKQLRQAGVKREIALCRLMGRDDKDRVSFLTHVEDAPLVDGMKMPQRRPFVVANNATVGRVTSINKGKVVSEIIAMVRDIEPRRIGAAIAKIKYVSQKKPIVVELRSITISLLQEPECSR